MMDNVRSHRPTVMRVVQSSSVGETWGRSIPASKSPGLKENKSPSFLKMGGSRLDSTEDRNLPLAQFSHPTINSALTAF